MAEQLPFDSADPFYEFSTILEGGRYYFNVRWNGRDEAWYFDLLDEEQSPIRHGIKIVLGTVLGRRVVDERWPPGVMVAHDTSHQGLDAGVDDLGTRVIVVYYTAAEVVAATPAAQALL